MNTLRAATLQKQCGKSKTDCPESRDHVSIFPSGGQLHEATPHAIALQQSSFPYSIQEEHSKDRVLLVDSDPVHAAGLEDALQSAEYRVSLFSELKTAIDAVKVMRVELVVLVHRSRAQWKSDLELLLDAMRGLKSQPSILCVLRWNRKGPDDRLYGDQLNVGVLYER